MNQWVNATIIKNEKFKQKLFRIILNASIPTFIAGQFAKLAIKTIEGKMIKRVYSYVNPPKEKNLEFLIRLVSNGLMSHALYHLKPGDNILISKISAGFFTINEIPKCKILWMFATGTAVGPFCSILQDGNGLNKFEKIILIHAVRYSEEFIYLKLINKIKKKYSEKFIFQAITSQEKNSYSLTGRIPDLLKKNIIEESVGYNIQYNTSHVMLCGNPDMVKNTQNFLIHYRNLKKHLRRLPGNITSENYW